MWIPWTRAEVEARVTEEEAFLDADLQQRFELHREEPSLVPWRPGIGTGDAGLDPDSIWIVARTGRRILFLDTIEEDFGIGDVTSDGQLIGYSLYGPLRVALLHWDTA